MLSLATQCRQYTTIRLPRSQGSLPVASLTALTLWARTIHTLSTFSPQDRITSIAPLLRIQYPVRQRRGVRGYATATGIREIAGINAKEKEIAQLAQNSSTINRAVAMYKESLLLVPLDSLMPWMLLSRCYEMQDLAADALLWLSKSLSLIHINEPSNTMHDLLLLAYIKLGQDQQLRNFIMDFCASPAPISASTMALVLSELEGSSKDRSLACRLWEAIIKVPKFAPSRECVQLAIKIALHNQSIDLAVNTYQMVLAQKWSNVKPGFWAEKVMVYGLAINGMAQEAFEVAAATTEVSALSTSGTAAIQAIHKFELLLNGLSKSRCANEAIAVFWYVRDELGLYPSISMYNSLLGLLAANGASWDTITEYLDLIEKDGYSIPESLLNRVLLGVAKQGQMDMCNQILNIMASRHLPFNYIAVLAALEVYARQGDMEMIMRWYNVVYRALQHQTSLSSSQQLLVRIDSPRMAIGGAASLNQKDSISSSSNKPNDVSEIDNGENQYKSWSIEHPEQFIDYFIANNVLIWHRSVLACLIELMGELGDEQLVKQLWENISDFGLRVRTLKTSPSMYMSLARSLARHGLLSRYESLLCMWISDKSNKFSYSQQREALDFVKLCLENHRIALRKSARAGFVAAAAATADVDANAEAADEQIVDDHEYEESAVVSDTHSSIDGFSGTSSTLAADKSSGRYNL
ncbi:hypothetical protein J3B02_002419 [Coemansia erecta]|nr:hypothetical protein J3B02_002419 [Coemansia erecta]KAJ2886423.1 hypothetical protein FB639_001577 [Coemansia asiatica]